MIGLVQATGIDAVRVALGNAGDSLRLGLTHVRDADTSRLGLPLFGRGDMYRHVDERVRLASASLHEALDLLDGIEVEAGAGTAAIEHVRAAIREVTDFTDARMALAKPKDRWHYRAQERPVRYHELEDLGLGLDAVSSGSTAAWAIADRPHYFDATRFFAIRAALVDLDPDAARLRPFVPEHGDGFRGMRWHEVVEPMLEEGSPDDVASRDVLWNLIKHVWARHAQWNGTGVHADDLRRMLAAARPGIEADRIPAWLRDAGSEPLTLDATHAADLAASAYSSREAAELGLATALLSPNRYEFGYDLDHAAVLRDALHRLPERLRPDVPEVVVTDEVAAMEWARAVRTRRAREFVGDRPPSTALVRDVLLDIPKKDSGQAVGAVLVARQLLDAMPGPGGSVRDVAFLQLRRQLREFVEAHERGWFVDYADIGRVQATSETVARFDELLASRVAARTTGVREPLTW